MKRLRLVLPAFLLLALPPAAPAQTGGVAAPDATGGVEYGRPVAKPKKKRKPVRLVASQFSAPATLQPGGGAGRFTYRVDGRGVRRVRVRIDLVKGRTVAARIRLGWTPTGRVLTYDWAPKALAEGDYEARLHAVDDAGRTLTRQASSSGRSALHVAAPPAPPAAPVRVGSGLFPVQGRWSFGGEDARFGADRNDHSHQGQDITAPEGTPVVSPRAGSVLIKKYQAGGAGHYVVVHGDDGRDYVFMHLVAGSIPVGKGDLVQAGQQIGQVGSTGSSSGPHLHFEIWPNGWYAKDSQPIDPRPDLEAWAAG